jgi:SAM-dependent methyltransferase
MAPVFTAAQPLTIGLGRRPRVAQQRKVQGMILDELLEQQREFYDQRATEWRDWIECYMGPVSPRIRALLGETIALHDSEVLEVAAGTGYLTQWLAGIARHVSALDASPSMLAELDSLGLSNVTTMCHDVFDWSPSCSYGAVVCANWLSHVPNELWTAHWAMLDRALCPGGVVVAIDATVDEIPHLGGHPWWQSRLDDGHREPLTTRELNDGRRYTVVKQFWEPEQLLADVRPLGWRGEHVRVSEDRGIIFYRFWRA